ncbi:MAG: hypothetical protein ACREBW_07340 [Candidatus Micrarchaeaceae archaeon]
MSSARQTLKKLRREDSRREKNAEREQQRREKAITRREAQINQGEGNVETPRNDN